MSTIQPQEESSTEQRKSPGEYLAKVRQEQGYSPEQVAAKLHLRVRIIECLEADNYEALPQPVFVKGYLRSYAKFLHIDHAPLVEIYNAGLVIDAKQEKALWQNRRVPHRADRALRWVTIIVAVGVLIAIGVWWQRNLDTLSTHAELTSKGKVATEEVGAQTKLTDLSKMQPLLTPDASLAPKEKAGG